MSLTPARPPVHIRSPFPSTFRLPFAAREFLTRALLSARADLSEVLDVLSNDGVGTADGFNVNMAFLDVPAESRVFQTIEVTPRADDTRSDLYVTDFPTGSNSLHTNRWVRPGSGLRETVCRSPRETGRAS